MSEITTEMVIEMMNKYIQDFIGDTPVQYQIGEAMATKANVNEQHAIQEEICALRDEVRILNDTVQRLVALIGDTPVSEQICMALNG